MPIVSVLDGHSHGLAFLGAALGRAQIPLGVDDFGQSGTRADLYRHYGIDAPAIAAAARTLLGRGCPILGARLEVLAPDRFHGPSIGGWHPR